MIGCVLANRYRLVKRLSSSNMAQTYLAEDVQSEGVKCVVKQLQPTQDELNLFDRNKRLFEAEAKTLGELGAHDQIPDLWSYFEENKNFYLVQEFIEGETLVQELQNNESWTESQVISFLQEMVSLLVFVHAHNVIHRDIKPANIMRRYRDGRLMLIDFGAVKQIQMKQPKLSTQTSVAVIVGTPGYMPAEQLDGNPKFSSDIYALGMVAIQLLTGLLPKQITKDDDGELLWSDQVDIGNELASILTKMVRRYHKRRYSTATEALKAIQSLSLVSQAAENDRALDFETIKEEIGNGLSALEDDDPSINGRSIIVSSQQRTIPVAPAEPDDDGEDLKSVEEALSSRPSRSRRLMVVGGLTLLLSALSSVGYWVHAKSIEEHRLALNSLKQLRDNERYGECITQANALPAMGKKLTAQGDAILRECQIGQEQVVAFEQLQTWEMEMDYEVCIQTAEDFPGPDTVWSVKAMEVMNQCRENLAGQLAESGQYVAAINTVAAVPLEAENYKTVQTLMSQWSYRILDIAKEQYDQEGNLQTATAFIDDIPEFVAAYKPAQQKLAQWEAELSINQKLIREAEEFLAAKEWQKAIDSASKVNTTFFKAKAVPIINTAIHELHKIQEELRKIQTPLVDKENVLANSSPTLTKRGTRYHEYPFSGEAGKTISIMMESEDFDPYLYLIGPDGERVATNDDRPDGDYSSAINIPLSQTGTYRVQATTYGRNDGGRYSLIVRYVPD